MQYPDLPIIKVARVKTAEEVEELVGTTVPEVEANIKDFGIYVDEETEEPLFIYAPFIGNLSVFRNAILNTDMGTTTRASGFQNVSRTFGMAPRKAVLQRESCKATSLAVEKPDIHAVLEEQADTLKNMLMHYLPEQFEQDSVVMEQVEEDWRITDKSLWTSGVINQSSALPYHRDRSNFETWSAMPVIRRGMRGGYLNIPSHNVTLHLKDGTSAFFNGYKLVHGVTPMNPTTPDSYRYSVVFYALRGMKDCHTTALEQAEARKRRTEREEKVAIEKSFEEEIIEHYEG